MCNYELQFETPYACSRKRVEEWKQIIEPLTHSKEFEMNHSEFTIQID